MKLIEKYEELCKFYEDNTDFPIDAKFYKERMRLYKELAALKAEAEKQQAVDSLLTNSFRNIMSSEKPIEVKSAEEIPDDLKYALLESKKHLGFLIENSEDYTKSDLDSINHYIDAINAECECDDYNGFYCGCVKRSTIIQLAKAKLKEDYHYASQRLTREQVSCQCIPDGKGGCSTKDCPIHNKSQGLTKERIIEVLKNHTTYSVKFSDETTWFIDPMDFEKIADELMKKGEK